MILNSTRNTAKEDNLLSNQGIIPVPNHGFLLTMFEIKCKCFRNYRTV